MLYNIHDCFCVVSKEYRDKQHIVLESDEYHIEQDHISSYNFHDFHWKGDVIEGCEGRLEQEFDLEERYYRSSYYECEEASLNDKVGALKLDVHNADETKDIEQL
jgi:hypothetical protein